MAEVVGIVLYDRRAEDLALWVFNDTFRQGMREHLDTYFCTPLEEEVGREGSSSEALADAAAATIEQHILRRGEGMEEGDGEGEGAGSSSSFSRGFVFLLVAVFWNGQGEASRAAFAQLRQLADDRSPRYAALRRRIDGLTGRGEEAEKGKGEKSGAGGGVPIEILVQALNAKEGAHGVMGNAEALVRGLVARLNSARGLVGGRKDGKDSGGEAKGGGRSPAPARPPAEADLSPAVIAARVEKGQGECFWTIRGDDRAGVDAREAELRANARRVGVACAPVLPKGDPEGGRGGGGGCTREFLLRRDAPGGGSPELRLALCGNVDSGKSTLTAVLTRGCHDDGRGFARAFVFKHKHEASTGRTSSISENYIGFSGTGEVVNYQLTRPRKAGAGSTGEVAMEGGGNPTARAAAVARQYTPQELSLRSCKMLTLYDLAGHARYLKTTVLGLTRNVPDYACIVISANNGIQRMTKEHLALCLALKLPFFVVVTRVDSTPANIHAETIENIHRLLKIPSVRKLPYPVRLPEELVLAAKYLRNDRIAPIFEVSNVTGAGIPRLLQFLNLLPIRKDWEEARRMPREMIIDNIFSTCVGTVVGGVVTQGVFHVEDSVLLGPNAFGHYHPVGIKSIHVLGVDVASASAGHDAAFCLKKIKRSGIRKGNILAEPNPPPLAFWQFEADIVVLYHSTTITTGYEPMIHAPTVRQSAKVIHVEKEVLRTGDRSLVRFHFLYRPEFIKEGQRLIMREGNTKGIGIVTRVMEKPNETIIMNARQKKRQTRFTGAAAAIPSEENPNNASRKQ